MAKAQVSKVAVSVDADLLRRVERVRERTGESRSAIVSRALRQLTHHEERARRVLEYVEEYRAMPETQADVMSARAATRRAVLHLPWHPLDERNLRL